jgi:SPP1 family predicted phage head-tail adaptor
MTMLSSRDIKSMHDICAAALPDTGTIQRQSAISDGGGGQNTSWATLASVACELAPLGGGEARSGLVGERLADETTHTITFAHDTDITEADRVVVNGVTYDVTLVDRGGAWELERRVVVREAP